MPDPIDPRDIAASEALRLANSQFDSALAALEASDRSENEKRELSREIHDAYLMRVMNIAAAKGGADELLVPGLGGG